MAKKKTVWEKNFAESARVRERVAAYMVPKTQKVRQDRITMEEDMMKFFKMWNVTHDGNHNYNGRAKLYIPEVRKNVEAQARQLTEAAFPNDDCFDVSPGSDGSSSGALIHKSVRLWQINQAKLRTKYHVYARQQALYGTSPVYVPWNRHVERVFRSVKAGKDGRIQPKIKEVELFNGPDFVVKDLFKWYALDPTRQDVLQGGCVEYYAATKYELLQRDKDGDLYGLKELLERGNSDAYLADEMMRDIERAESIGLQIQNQGYASEASFKKNDGEAGPDSTYKVGLIYTKMVLPEACEEGEDPEMPIPVKIEIYNDEHVGLVKRNPFWHQRPPYLVGKYIQPNPDQFYGQGIPWAIQYMQYEINSTAEQTMDSKTLALNPIAIIDPALAGNVNDFQSEPGATWFVRPDGVKFTAAPDLSATGYQAISILRSQMQDYSDRSPALPPQLLGKSRTATQSEIVSNSMSIDNKSFQIQNEQAVLEPLMQMWESLTDQNITEDQVIMILGERATDWKRKLITKNQTLGSYHYFWKAASMLQNRQILSRQMIDMMKVVGSLPPEAQAKLQFNYTEAVKKLWTDGFGLADAGKILGTPEEMQTQDPEVEHKMLELGMEIEVMPADEDPQHIQSHDLEMAKLHKAGKKSELKTLFMHTMKHRQQLQGKVQLMQQQKAMRDQMMMMQMAQNQNGGSGPSLNPATGETMGSSNVGGLQGSGNRAQLSPNSNPGDMGSGVRS